MFLTSDSTISNLVIHNVGNKLKGDSIILSAATIPVDSELEEVLKQSIFAPFRSSELFAFDVSVENPVYDMVINIFKNPNSLLSESKKIAKYLFENAENPKMNGGNVFFVFFKNFILDDTICDGIGIFKTETTDTYIKLNTKDNRTTLEKDSGINIKKLTKGAIIFNTDVENGYFVSIVDKRPKSEDVSYWAESFLDVIPRQDSYYQTKNTMIMVEHFISNGLPDLFKVNRAEQVELLNRSLGHFRENNEFIWDSFTKEVFVNNEVIGGLEQYKDSFQQDNEIEIAETFEINLPAVRKHTKLYKSVIKLDDRFEIVIHKDKDNMIRGKDKATGMNSYTLLFRNEE